MRGKMRWCDSLLTNRKTASGYYSGGRASHKLGSCTDSAGVRLVSTDAAKREQQIKDEMEHESLFASRRDKVRAVTLPCFSWTDEKGWPK